MMTTPWGGRVPEKWSVARLKHVCRAVGGGTPDKSKTEFWCGDIPWVSPKDMKTTRITDTEDHISEEGLQNSATQLVQPNAVLIVMRSGILRHSVPVAINQVPVALNQDMRALIPDKRLVPEYLAWLIEGHQSQLLRAWSKVGATVESLESDLVGDTLVPLPSLKEQRAIINYLDHETGRLDALIATKKRLLDLIAEKRRAIIASAVTQGLNPAAPMRDSGGLWLGKIPAHWKIIALRFLVDISSGATPDTGKPELWDGDIPWVSPKDMKQIEIQDAQDHVSAEALSSRALRLIEPVSVLVVVRGMILAHSFPTATTSAPITINQDIKALHCRNHLDPHFLRDFFRGVEPHIVSLADSSAHGTRKLETEVLGRLEVCVPPLEEQREIVRHVAQETMKLEKIRATTERTIALLKERRDALIAAVVTGQLEVR